ncbi:MAG: hypothetical protein MO852_08255, partial [Candidatus Devosia euplotis]|nr:hypothetical protein [Candidatus Devosia euplotis]
ELQAISMVYPLLVTLFSIPLLGEKVRVFRFVAVGRGLCRRADHRVSGGVAVRLGRGFRDDFGDAVFALHRADAQGQPI